MPVEAGLGAQPAQPAHPLRIELFGRLRITRNGEVVGRVATTRLQSLLTYLVLHGGAPITRESLAFVLWPDSNEAQARTNLRQLLHHLRRSLPETVDFLNAEHQGLEWRRDARCAVDVAEFDDAMRAAETAAAAGDALEEYRRLEEAARLYQDELMPGLYDDWVRAARDRYRQSAARVFARLAELLEGRGEYPEAIRYAERLVAQDPLRESSYQLLIRLHALNRDRASALRAYHQCMRALRRELGVEPGVATRALFERVLKSEATLPHAEAPPPLSEAPSLLIGRRKEWQNLMACWNAAATGGTHVAVIPGEPGIGKSRLAEELYSWCKRGRVAAGRARCYAAQGGLAYAPVAEWLRAEPLRAAWARISRAQMAEVARVVPEILDEDRSIPAPQPLTEGWQRRHFYDALTAVFAKAPKPLLLVVDDVQWCDADSLEWLSSFLTAELDGGVLVLATVRSEETGRDHPFTRLWNRLLQSGRAVEIPLAPLDAAETAALGSQAANRPLRDAESAQLYRATQGNPLFVVESVRAGLEEGVATPPRVHAVIAARLGQLSSPAYELAGFAAVIGRPFSFDLLGKATDWDEESLSAALDELWQRRIIALKGEAQYDFTHDRLREVAAAELSPVRKRLLHRRVARALGELHAGAVETVAGEMAAHYEAGQMAEEAIRCYRQAAALSHGRYADAEAAADLRRAVALCRELPAAPGRREQELELLISLGSALFTTVGYAAPEVGENARRAVALFRELGAEGPATPVLSGAWVYHTVRADMPAAKRIAEELLGLGGAMPSMAGHAMLTTVLFHLGEFRAADVAVRKALAGESNTTASERALFAIPGIAVFNRAYRAHLLWHLGCPDQAEAAIEETKAAAAADAHPFGLAIAYSYAALLHVFRREVRPALLSAEEALEVCGRYDFAYYRSMADVVAGWARSLEGDFEVGLPQLRHGFEALKAGGAELRFPFYHALLAEACARAGKTGEALANISNGLAFQTKNGENWSAPYLHLTHGDLLAAAGAEAEARASYGRALDAAQSGEAPMLALRAACRICRVGPPRPNDLRRVAELRAGITEGLATDDLREAERLIG